MYIHFSGYRFKSICDIYTSRSGWGLDSALLYYVVHFLATTGCSWLNLVNGPYDSQVYIQYDRILHFSLYAICGMVSFSLHGSLLHLQYLVICSEL